MSILIVISILFFALTGSLSGSLSALPSDTLKNEDPYRTHVSVSGTVFFGIPVTGNEADIGYLNPDQVTSDTSKTVFDFRDSWDNHVFASLADSNAGPILIGGAILSNGKFWIGAGPGKLAGSLANLASIMPSGPIPESSIPISISSSSSYLVSGFGTKNIAIVMKEKLSSGKEWENASLVIADGNEDFRAGLALSRIERKATYQNLGWRPSEKPEPDLTIFRLTAGISAHLENVRFEWRSAFSSGRTIPRGAGIGVMLSWQADCLSLDGGFSLSEPESRNLDGVRIKERIILIGSARYRGEDARLLTLRVRSAEVSQASTTIDTAEDPDTETEMGNEDLTDTGTPALAGGREITWDATCALPFSRRDTIQKGSFPSSRLAKEPEESGDSGGNLHLWSAAMEFGNSGCLNASSFRFGGRLGFHAKGRSPTGIQAALQSKLQITHDKDLNTGYWDSGVFVALLGMELEFPASGGMNKTKQYRQYVDMTLGFKGELSDPGHAVISLNLSAGSKVPTGKALALVLKLNTDASSLSSAFSGSSMGVVSGSDTLSNKGISITISLEGTVDTVR